MVHDCPPRPQLTLLYFCTQILRSAHDNDELYLTPLYSTNATIIVWFDQFINCAI